MIYIIIIILAVMLLIKKINKSKNIVSIEEKNKKVSSELSEPKPRGIIIGKTDYGKDYFLSKEDINKFCFVIGATGTGKTVTLRNIYKGFLEADFPIIYLDAKPSKKQIEFIVASAKEKGKEFLGFNCSTFSNYDFLSTGTPTEITEKLMCIKDEWSNDFYKNLASNYLQILIKFFVEEKIVITVRLLVSYLDPKKFMAEARKTKSPLLEKISNFSNVKKEDLLGLYNHLSYFSDSDLGQYFEETNEKKIVLDEVVKQNKVVYFALPFMQYPEFSKGLGKLIINDIKGTLRRLEKPTLIIMDEYSVFAGEQVLGIVTQGREYGAHLIIGTQSIDNLPFWEDLLANANVSISHRVNSSKTADEMAKYFSTKDSYQITRRVSEENDSLEGSFRKTKEFIVHPESLKKLEVGETYISVKSKNEIEKVKIKLL